MKIIPAYSFIQALAAAILFGASAPLTKLLVGEIEPVPLAAFLYLGAGASLAIFQTWRRAAEKAAGAEAPLRGSDFPWLAGAILAGGVGAPIALLWGLRYTSAAVASLLLNFEGIATTLLASLVFKEAVGLRVWWAVAFITAASLLLSWEGGPKGFAPGALGVIAACFLWGIDNNLTRHLSAKDPASIVLVKGLGASSFSLALALVTRIPLPAPGEALLAMLLGSTSYGVSIILYILALRHLGAARTGAAFGTAPFAGTALSLLMFREMPNWLFFISLSLMVVGAVLLLGEEHEHLHVHLPSKHEHRHRHDNGHHIHTHEEGEIEPSLSHSHLHWHKFIKHAHPHAPDLHHRHGHSREDL